MKDMIFYTIAGTVIALVAQFAHASLAVTILASLLLPPVFILIFRIAHH